jgi:hypothetical protein
MESLDATVAGMSGITEEVIFSRRVNMESDTIHPLSANMDIKDTLKQLYYRLAKRPSDVKTMESILETWNHVIDGAPPVYLVRGSDCAIAWFMFLTEQLLRAKKDLKWLLVGRSSYGSAFPHYVAEIQRAVKEKKWVFIAEDDGYWIYDEGEWIERNSGFSTGKIPNVREIHLIDETATHQLPTGIAVCVHWEPFYSRCWELHRVHSPGKSALVYSDGSTVIVCIEPTANGWHKKIGTKEVHYYGQELGEIADAYQNSRIIMTSYSIALW